MISGKTTLTSFNSVSSIVSLAESIPLRGGYFFSCTNMSKNYSPFIVVEGDGIEPSAQTKPYAPNCTIVFGFFPSVNIHCFRSLFKTSEPHGWLVDKYKFIN